MFCVLCSRQRIILVVYYWQVILRSHFFHVLGIFNGLFCCHIKKKKKKQDKTKQNRQIERKQKHKTKQKQKTKHNRKNKKAKNTEQNKNETKQNKQTQQQKKTYQRLQMLTLIYFFQVQTESCMDIHVPVLEYTIENKVSFLWNRH